MWKNGFLILLVLSSAPIGIVAGGWIAGSQMTRGFEHLTVFPARKQKAIEQGRVRGGASVWRLV